jgi:hypothetical protein
MSASSTLISRPILLRAGDDFRGYSQWAIASTLSSARRELQPVLMNQSRTAGLAERKGRPDLLRSARRFVQSS